MSSNEINSFKDSFFTILKQGARIVDGFMLDVSHISNHQINSQFARQLASTMTPFLKKLSPEVFLTAAASGPGLTAYIASHTETINVLYAKKSSQLPKIFSGRPILSRRGISPTKGDEFNFYIRKDLLQQYKSFLVVDDFLRSGRTLEALIDMGTEAGLELKGVFTLIAIEEGKKRFQQYHNCPVLSGITIKSIEENNLVISEVLTESINENLILPTYP